MGQDYSVLELPLRAKRFEGRELARGYFDRIVLLEDRFLVTGWMLLPDRDFDSIQVYLNGKLYGPAEVKLRGDLGKSFWWIPHAERAGFQFDLNKSRVEISKVGRLDMLGCKDNRAIARMSTLFRPDLDRAVPSPPPELMERVAATRDPHRFKVAGLKCFGEFLKPICRHRDLCSDQRLLDWGCGSGRVTCHFLLLRDGPKVFGCDIDAEAIAWCSDHLSPGVFTSIEPWPPTPYEDATFDFVISYSVFTHLSREAQNAWLAEMRRIVAPEGLFLASTHGEFAASFAFPNTLTKVLRNGISDENLDPRLDGIAPQGYYRSVFQTREHTTSEWSKYFEILEYVERGIGNYQDLVVMRRS